MSVERPTNTEIVEKTGVVKGSVSEIMSVKREPTKNFIDKFKKGFNVKEDRLSLKLKNGKMPNDNSLVKINSKEYINHLLK